MSERKDTNPKDFVATTRVPLGLIPSTALGELSLAHLEGSLKYGQYNWRVAGVKAMVYINAAKRHIDKYLNGQQRDPKTLVHHLANAMACCAIIIDAEVCDKLIDDRPPTAPVDEQFEALEQITKHLLDSFGDIRPRHYTIADSETAE